MKCLRLRVKDLEFEQRAFIVRDDKEAQDRVTVLSDSLIPLLQEHLQRVKALHEQDLAQGFGDEAIDDGPRRRQARICRPLQEAAEQGAAPTVGDLANALEVSEPTVRQVQTRGRRGG
jgi:hypothetical protein